MTYNLSNPLDVQNIRLRLEKLIKKGCFAVLTEKKPKRTLDQNSYLHVALGYLAAETHNKLEWVKERYYKIECNPDLFVRTREDKVLGKVEYLRSSTDLDTGEMTLSIERLRNWSAEVAEVYIPSPDERSQVEQMQIEIERKQEWIY